MPLFNPPVTVSTTILSIAKTTSPNITTTAVSILAAEPTRKGLTIMNNTSSTFFIDSVNTVSATDYMVSLPAGAYYEIPAYNGAYTGALFAICPAGFGTGGTLLIRDFRG